MASTFDFFRRAERIEALAAAIYAALAVQFAADAATRDLFVRLEREELQHASRIRLLASSYRGDSRLIDRVSGAADLEACCGEAEAALREVQAGTWGTDLAGVKARLAALEVRLSKAHAHVLAQDGNASLRDFFRQLALQDDAHARLLGST